MVPHDELAYNKTPSMTTDMSPFKIVYKVEPLSPLYLMLRSMEEKPCMEASKRVQEIKSLHEQAKSNIEKSNASYQAQANKHRRRMVF